jgi:hypothetical protein
MTSTVLLKGVSHLCPLHFPPHPLPSFHPFTRFLNDLQVLVHQRWPDCCDAGPLEPARVRQHTTRSRCTLPACVLMVVHARQCAYGCWLTRHAARNQKGLSFISNRQLRKEGTFCASEVAGIEPEELEQGYARRRSRVMPAFCQLGYHTKHTRAQVRRVCSGSKRGSICDGGCWKWRVPKQARFSS